MNTLNPVLRNQLGKAIVAARREAETGARKALESLGVDHHEPHGSMSIEERRLRNRLRARGRQLGDVRDRQRGTQSIDRLIHEIAYEHWHRMLFARFLAENSLLIHPEHGIAVSLEEVEELAREAGEDPRSMAARFAQDSLPEIFRSGDPVLEVELAPETRQALDRLLEDLPPEIFTADDSLGWTYQFWQTEKKKAVNDSGNKIGADELPAVTQLFTEHYMVQFLFHNTIGAWRAGKILGRGSEAAGKAASEEELRRELRLDALGGYDFDFLRFVQEQSRSGVPPLGETSTSRDGSSTETRRDAASTPAAGAFEGWPRTAAELKILDPCCGSGHFLVEGLHILVRLRMEEENLGVEEALRRVLAENLFGLELDPRCAQIAAFSVALAAWKMAGRPFELPALNIACSGLAVGSTKAEWVALAGGDEYLGNGMEQLYDLFKQAPELGSLIDPGATRTDLYRAEFSELRPLLERALADESDDAEDTERAVTAQGMAKAAELLAGEYTLVITNVPYLTRHDHSKTLTDFTDANYYEARADLATVFIERIQGFLASKCSLGIVAPQNWLHQYRYSKFRENLLNVATWNFAVWLGPGAFQTISGEVVKPILIGQTALPPKSGHKVLCIEASNLQVEEKISMLSSPDAEPILVTQESQAKNPDFRFLFESQDFDYGPLSKYCKSFQGLRTGDVSRFVRTMWETLTFDDEWVPFKTSSKREEGSQAGHTHSILWEQGQGQLDDYASATRDRLHDMHESGNRAWGTRGVAFGQITLRATHYYGEHFDNTLAVIVPRQPADLPAILAFCESDKYVEQVRRIERGLYVTNASLIKVPFDLDHWQTVAVDKYPNGLPEPQSNDPTQWLFHGHPAGMVAAGPAERSPLRIADPVGADRHPSLICREPNPGAVLQVAVARLLGYRWPAELDAEMELDEASRAWVERCEALLPLADDDGIVCLQALRGESTAADRLRSLLARSFGELWSPALERELLGAASGTKKPADSLETWLSDRFFEEHCKLFHHRPFVWHLWDGRKDGFHCLINAHRLTGPDGEGRRTLEAITYSYLGDWIDRQRADQRAGKEGADGRLVAALGLQGRLEKILEGEPPFDLFIRWKSLAEQPLGWEPDINDGVRLNIRPFMKAELRSGGKKGAGLLRWKPNVKWTKDRGKEPQSLRPKNDYPWFWSCPGDGTAEERTDFEGGKAFDGNRWNDLHYGHEVKRAAREGTLKEDKL
jgi:hypothetical protein